MHASTPTPTTQAGPAPVGASAPLEQDLTGPPHIIPVPAGEYAVLRADRDLAADIRGALGLPAASEPALVLAALRALTPPF
jgi:hypothetical protein